MLVNTHKFVGPMEGQNVFFYGPLLLELDANTLPDPVPMSL